VTPLQQEVAIVGIGQTEFSKASGRSELQLAAESAKAAIDDAGLEPSDIDGMVSFTVDANDELLLMRCLGIAELRWLSRTPFGGAAANSTIRQAAAAVVSGSASHVLVYRAFNERSGRRFGQPNEGNGGRSNWYKPIGVDTPAKTYALNFQRYMFRFGVTNEDFGRYTVVARKHAATNPNAWFYQRPMTLEDHQNSRWVVEPVLRLLDCCQESDGGVAMIVTTADRARDARNPVTRVVATAESNVFGGHVVFNHYHEDLTTAREATSLATQIFGASDVTRDDIDAAMIYENFSPSVFLQLEGLGFCGPGEARDFIAEGNIELGGKLPINTHGGLLGEGYIHGMNNVLEAVRQIRGTSVNQIAGASHVLATATRSALLLAGPS
jgi:acetyl-CoA acetyltransferase